MNIKLKICTSCGHYSDEQILPPHLACCPDSDYISVKEYILKLKSEKKESRNTLLEEIKVLAKKESEQKKVLDKLKEENDILKIAVLNLEGLLDGDGLKNKQIIDQLRAEIKIKNEIISSKQ